MYIYRGMDIETEVIKAYISEGKPDLKKGNKKIIDGRASCRERV